MYVLTDEGLGQIIAAIDVEKAVRLNRYYGKELGWAAQYDRIAALVGFPGFTTYPPDEKEFAEAIARWQQRQGLKGSGVDGVIGDKTWSLMRIALGTESGLGALGKSVTIRPKQVRNLIKARDPELHALIAPIPLPCKVSKGACVFKEVRREVIGGNQHIWALAVRFSVASLADGGKTLEFSPTQNTVKGKTVITHRILIEINPLRLDRPELKKQIPKDQDRLEFLVAESLFHELIHAVILIERSLPLGVVHTNVFLEFDRLWKTANSTRLHQERLAVKQALQKLLALAGVQTTNPTAAIDNYFQFLINEKYAKQLAAAAFGHPINNDQVAASYSKVAAARIESSGTPLSDVRLWRQGVNQLSETVKRLYDKLDLLPEMVPSPTYGPPLVVLEPPILKL